jgi:hypothetical protein
MAKKSLRTIIKEPCSQEELDAVFSELASSSDRGAAILVCVHLQDSLSDLIFLQMKNQTKPVREAMFGRDGPLFTFSSSIHLAFALGLIKEEIWKTLDSIRTVRNAYAHALKPLKFTTPEIAAVCSKLRASRSLRAMRKPFVPASQGNPNRDIFINTCMSLSYHFIGRANNTLMRKSTKLQRQIMRLQHKRQNLLSGLLAEGLRRT